MIRNKLSLVGFGRFGRNRLAAFLLLFLVLLFGVGTVSSHPYVIPTISITSVKAGETVTIQTHNFPAGMTFNVTMGKMYTQGIGGIYVGQIYSGYGGSFPVTFDIPPELQGDALISIRAQTAHLHPYYAYNWFYNNSTDPYPPDNTGPIYTGIPTFKITAVKEGETVTIKTNNFPAGLTFAVTMGKMYTRGIGGIKVADFYSGSGGTLTATFNIPPELKDDALIAIRAQTAHGNPYYAFNWFYNTTAVVDDGGGGDDGTVYPVDPVPVHTGIPTFKVCTVNKDGNVTILTHNFPQNQTFNVTMGAMYTQGINGIPVEPLSSEGNTSARYTFTIPEALKGSYRISIRAQTAHKYPYYAYNWFYNNSTTMDHCP